MSVQGVLLENSKQCRILLLLYLVHAFWEHTDHKNRFHEAVADHSERRDPLQAITSIRISPSVQKDSWILCSSIPRRLSLTLAKISETRWSDNDLQSVIERMWHATAGSTSQAFIDLICPMISTRAPRSLSAISSPCCSAYVSAWRVLRHTRLIVVVLKGQRHDSVPVAVVVFDLREVSEKVTSSLLGFKCQTGCLWRGCHAFTAMLATGDLGEGCVSSKLHHQRMSRKNRQNKQKASDSTGCLWVQNWIPLAPGNLQAGSPAQCPYPPHQRHFDLALISARRFLRLFDAQIGSDDFTFAFRLAFTLSLGTTEGSESRQLNGLRLLHSCRHRLHLSRQRH